MTAIIITTSIFLIFLIPVCSWMFFTDRYRFFSCYYWRCLVFHSLVIHKYWKMNGWGVGGGRDAWCLKCEDCDSRYTINEDIHRERDKNES